MGQAIRVLLTEDVPDDAELELHVLKKAGFDVDSVRVDTEADFRHHLDAFSPDLVISDFSLPGFDGLSALTIAREKRPDVPFIFVSGTIGEERAIESFKRGATDYVVKTNLSRLPPVVRRALEEAEQRKVRRKAELSLLENEEKFRAIVETTQEWIWEMDKQGRCTFSSPFIHVLLGYYAEEMLGTDRLAQMHPQDRAEMESRMSPAAEGGKRGWRDLVLRWRRRDGSYRWLESNAIPLLDEADQVFGFRGTERDVTERVHQQEKIARMSRIHTVLSEINAAIVRVHSRQDLFRQVCRVAVEQGEFRVAWIGLPTPGTSKLNPVAWMSVEDGYLDETGLSSKSAIGDLSAAGLALREKKVVVVNDIEAESNEEATLKTEAVSQSFRSLIALPLIVDGEVVALMALYAAQANFFDEEELKPLNNLTGDISYALDHIAKEEKLDYLSHHDPLTGLPNRALFDDRLGVHLQAAGQETSKVAVLLIDLERFRNINETLGRQAGDEVLKLVAQRLTEKLRDDASVARIGADCFAVAIPNVRVETDIAHLVEQHIFNALHVPLVVANQELRISAKLGITMFPTDGKDPESLVMNAEAALKKTKVSGDQYLFYAPQMHARIAERLTLENRLRRALEKDQFVLYYQPKQQLKDARITGMEALIRWQSPELGLVPPGNFIPLLEETGLILNVGRWVIQKALADCRALRSKGFEPPRIAVNVSALQLRQKGFVDDVAAAIGEHNTDVNLEAEVTETLLMDDLDGAIDKLTKVKEMGMSIALDDFGTGFSSLSYLIRLPVDCLKIDRSFIINMTKSSNGLTIVSAVISLAHSFNLKVVAEGVETQEQATLLQLLKCDEIQGYHFSRPVPLETIETMLEGKRH